MPPEEELKLLNEIKESGLTLRPDEEIRLRELSKVQSGLVEDLPFANLPSAQFGPDITLERQIPLTQFQQLTEDRLKRMKLLGETAKSFTSTAFEIGSEITLAGKGAKAGKAIGRKFFGEAAGATIGVGAGDQVAQAFERGFFPEEGEGMKFGSAESIKRSLTDTAFVGGVNLAGKVIVPVVEAISGIRAIRNMTPDDRQFARFLLDEFKRDPTLRVNPSLLNPRSKIFSFADNVDQYSFTTGSGVTEKAEKIQNLITAAMQNKALKLTKGQSREEVFKTIKSVAQGRLDQYEAALEATAQRINVLNESPIQISNPMAFVRKEFKTATGFDIPKEVKIREKLLALVGNRQGDFITLGKSQELINGLSRQINQLKRNKADDLLKNKLIKLRSKMLNQQVNQIKNAGDPSLAKDIRLFNQVQLDGPAKFNRDLLREMTLLDTEAAGSLYRIVKSPKKLRAIKGTIPKDAWKKVQGATIQDILAQSRGVDPFTGDTITLGVKLVANVNNIPDNIKSVVFNNVVLKNFLTFSKMLTRAQAQREATGKIFVQMAQAGAVSALILAAATVGTESKEVLGGSAAVILLGPKAIEAMFASEAITSALLKAASVPSRAPNNVRQAMIATILGLLTEKGIDYTVEKVGEEEEVLSPFEDIFSE